MQKRSRNSVSTQHSFIFLKPEVQSNPIKGERISYFLHIDSVLPKIQKLSDQQITPNGYVYIRKRRKKFDPKNIILMRGIAFEKITRAQNMQNGQKLFGAKKGS